MQRPGAQASIEVLWRPGCPYCSRLQRGLARAGVTTVERNIWADPDAAARVREVTGGNETVPTVLVGDRALVNPSVPEVIAAVRTQFPEDADRLLGAAPPTPEASNTAPTGWRLPAGWTLAAAALWVGLAVWRPTTTWHLGPVLAAAAAPWLAGRGVRTGERPAIGRLVAAAGAGLLAGILLTAVLAGSDLLRGPTLLGTGRPWAEAMILAAVAAALATVPGAVRVLRGPAPVRSAWLDGQLLARSADVVMLEGNAYFPAGAVRPGALTPTGTRTVCPWKGVAGYHSVTVDGVAHPDAAWTYRHPSPLARRIKDRVAFWGDVDIRIEARSADEGAAGGDAGDQARERMRR